MKGGGRDEFAERVERVLDERVLDEEVREDEEGPGPDAREAEATAYRRRRKPVRVRRNRWRDFLGFWRSGWKPAVAGLAAVAAALACYQVLFRSSWFVLAGSGQIETHITTGGAAQVTTAEVAQVFAPDLGRNVFFIPLEARRQALERIDWVKSAAVLRVLPAGLEVQLSQRVPVAFARAGDGVELIDADGVMLRRPRAGNYDFPALSGLTGADAAQPNQSSLVAARRQQMQTYAGLRDDLDAGGRHFSADFSEINLATPDNIAARVPVPGSGDTMLIKLGDHDFAARYQVYLDHIAQWRQQVPEMIAVDFHTDGEVDVERPPAATAPAAAGAKAAAKPGRRGNR